MMPRTSRRNFLRISAGALASSAMLSTVPAWQRALAATSGSFTDYKALVCVFLTGGNDGFNWFVPLSNAGYQIYSTNRRSLALPQTGTGAPLLLQGNGSATATASDGNQYGIHPSCPELQALFNSANMAVVANVGSLIKPTTQAAIASNSVPLPPQLFSHVDLQTLWQTSVPTGSGQSSGWAGRIADLLTGQGYSPNLSININVGGPNSLQRGAKTNVYVLGPSGAPVLDSTRETGWRNGLRAQTVQQLITLAAADTSPLVVQDAAILQSAASKVGVVNNSVSAAGDLTTTFTNTGLIPDPGPELHEVARIIKAHSQIGDARHIFFVSIGGFDTHNNELATQKTLLAYVSQQLSTFWKAMGEIGMQNNVTVFTASDFGRTIGSNGDGADHAWGNHHIVLGGAVKGGQFYGTMPNITIGGPDDYTASGVGQIIPTTSVDQYAATLAAWFGVPASSLVSVFPNLQYFPSQTLSFLG
jgi:uncharacterized protein (DUF1501 family)